MADFMLYWIPGTFYTLFRSGRPLDHLGSNHFHRVRSGDTVWIVTVRSGSLRLVGRLCVELVVDTAEARQILGTDDLWAAGYQGDRPVGDGGASTGAVPGLGRSLFAL